MPRSLPVVGHPISLKKIATSLGMDSSHAYFLDDSGFSGTRFLLSSATAALTLTLIGLKSVSARRHVILPAYTCPSVFASVVKAGLDPVLCDLESDSFRMDLDQLASKIDSNTLAIIAVHLFGIPENMSEIKRLIREGGVFLIEDAAQAFGNWIEEISGSCDDPVPHHVEKEDHRLLSASSGMERGAGARTIRLLGTIGDVGILSFGRGKPLGFLGGGAIVVNNPELIPLIARVYRSCGLPNRLRFGLKYFLSLFLYSIFYHPKLYWIPQGLPWLQLGQTNFTFDFQLNRMAPEMVRLGNAIISEFSEIRQTRWLESLRYAEGLGAVRDRFAFFPDMQSPGISLLRYPAVFQEKKCRDSALRSLTAKGLGVSAMYPLPLNEVAETRSYLACTETYPKAKRISEGLLTLPLHKHVMPSDIDLIVKTVLERSAPWSITEAQIGP